MSLYGDIGVFPVEIYKIIATPLWCNYRAMVACCKALHAAIYTRNWKRKYTLIYDTGGGLIELNKWDNIKHDLGVKFYRCMLLCEESVFIDYYNRSTAIDFIPVDNDEYDEGAYCLITNIYRFKYTDDYQFYECIDYDEETVTREILIDTQYGYTKLAHQTSKYEHVVYKLGHGTHRKLKHGVVWSLEDDFFIF
ncbi:hypothetical protein D5b_00004 [Faustovirus]|nr:hypothetical protein D5b_00004 [Faustovirus]AMN84904.1 hypothetical protein D6_00506 [Faustovirus]AMP43965.1 hypothetical protein PRJ_Dakar_00004 [Faustovirus]